jgi:ADP-ribosyl-[dinitrogen reductase] hydrolase
MTLDSRVRGAWWGSFIGDALAMPAHWYYQRHLIEEDYGAFDRYRAPHPTHPDSILWRSSYQSTGPKDDILHDQAQYWGRQGVHYHQFLQAGENTLNLKLAILLAESLRECGSYHQKDYVERYMDFMLTPGKHRDTYVEEYHRGFFRNHAAGKTLQKCGIKDQHIGGLATIIPLILHYHQDVAEMLVVLERHVYLTHKNEEVLRAARAFGKLLGLILSGSSMAEALAKCGAASDPSFALPFEKWARTEREDQVVGSRFSPACYIEDAFPASLFLGVKYAGCFREGLQANVRLGGDNCHRGVVLGALLGSEGGVEPIPKHWITGLSDHARLEMNIPHLF